jgi:uncharacterized protein YkwD
MKKYTIYETVSAGLLALSIIISGLKMSGRESLLDVRNSTSSSDETVALYIDTQSLTSPAAAPMSVENSEEVVSKGKSTQDQEAAQETVNTVVETEAEVVEEEIDVTEPTEYTTEETVAAEAEQVMDENAQGAVEATIEEGSAVEVTPETTVATEAVVQEVQETEAEPVAATEAPAPEPAAPSINYPPAGTIEYELFILVNNERAANGLSPLSWSGGLADCAYVRASEAVDCFSHTRPDGSDWWTVNPSIMYGENLATGQDNAQWVFNDWMASPDHRANILNPGYTTYGSSRVGNTWAQEFGY